MYKVVLIRHGESIWNKKNIFTGWVDVKLSRGGIKEAKRAKELLKDYTFDVAFTSLLKRAIDTLDIILKKNIPTIKAWQLNERHYGALQGKNKNKVKKEVGEEKFLNWRRGYDTPPPEIDENSKYDSRKEEMFKGVPVPLTESLRDVEERVVPYFYNNIAPEIKQGKRIIISSHGNTMRALLKHFLNVSNENVRNINVPTGIPLIIELNKDMKLIEHYYLGDQKEIREAVEEVKDEGK